MDRPSRFLVLVATVGLMVTACGGDNGASSSAAPTTTATAVSGDITVFAAASLKDSFTEIGTAFTQNNPKAKATFSFDASSALAQQIMQGAPADAFASADTANMDKLTGGHLNGSAPVMFATNQLAIIVPKGNPKSLTGVADLADGKGLKVVLCVDGVPCGTYAKQILASAKVSVTPVSLEQNVKGVVTKVTTGEADAGIVYTTDVQAAASQADAVAIPAAINV